MAGDALVSPAKVMAVRDGRIAALAESRDDLDGPADVVIDAAGRVLLPGFVDCHTHAVFAGDRSEEHRMRLAGQSYEDIARAGGGIASTVRAVRAASEAALIDASQPRLQALMREGVTSVEIKSGYGLDLANELKLLRATKALGERLPLDISATFLGAHAVPHDRSKSEYLGEVIEIMLPEVAREKLASAADIYVENIAFDNDDLLRLAAAADKAGLRLRAHTDQLSNMGGTALAASLGALSCDHLEFSNTDDVAAMARHGTIAVLLPGAFYFLRESKKPPIAALRAARVPMAVASDLNPGTSPVASLLTCLHFATTLFGLSSDEGLLGITINAARAMGRGAEVGSLEIGKSANFCIWDIPSPDYLCYQLGGLTPAARFFQGQQQ
ncbi:MAG: imidazolonepropionase [Gammaproteobacteria bacterium]|nr:imidazolonepropionase [Gammaproteobacteria bacterium]